MDYTHVTLTERGKTELLLSQGAGVHAIGRILGRSAGAISRERDRLRKDVFARADPAQPQG